MKTILCFGDSNTHGTKAMPDLTSRDRFPKSQRWPNVMAAKLGDGFDIIAEGHPGRTAAFDDPVEGEHKNGLRVLPALLESHRPVDLLIIMLGTNDLKARFGVPPIDIAIALERLAVCAAQSGAGPKGEAPRVLFVSPVPIEEIGFLGEVFEEGAAKARVLPEKLAQAADRQGADFIDLSEVASVDPIDGIHLTADGQRAIGDAIADKVQAIFNSAE